MNNMHLESDLALLKESSFFKEFIAERDEILRHKWIESEKAGFDIGFEKALLDWILRHRIHWLERRKRAGLADADQEAGVCPVDRAGMDEPRPANGDN